MSTGNQQQLLRYALPQSLTSEIQDTDKPLSYRTWIENYRGIIPGQEYAQYNQYLINWYKAKDKVVTDINLIVKINYLNLLKQLQLFFTDGEVEKWYNGVNLNNEKELLLAIPYFAKKLKDVALYYLSLRDNIKKSKIKYNLIGTETGITLQLQEFLLKNYTQKPNTAIAIPANIWKNVPALSSVQDTINIQVEELYDSFEYFDHSPTMPVSAYYDIDTPAIETYFNSLGLTLTSTEWVYKTGVFDISGNQIIDSINASEDLVNKYLASNKYTSLIYSISTVKDFYTVSIGEGNNFFFWPYGPYTGDILNLPRYKSQSLSAAGIETLATGGSSIELADTIFIKSKKGVQGAWLRYMPYSISPVNMKAVLDSKSVTRFRYPYPGYGLSAEDIDWTGPGLVTEPRFYYLSNDIKAAIENAYWSSSTELTSHGPISINSSTLIDSKAYASQSYNTADKIRIWETPPSFTDSVYNGPILEAWLYRMYKTDISIAQNSDSTIIWPYQKIDVEAGYPTNIPETVNKSCLPISLSSIQFINSTAGSDISSADILYKIQNYTDTSEQATECAWLSSSTIYYPDTKITAAKQPGLNNIFNSGIFTKFVWQGRDYTNNNLVFQSYVHQSTCNNASITDPLRRCICSESSLALFNGHQSDCKFITTPGATYKDYDLCTCRQVLFAPFGHPGDIFTDNASFSDFIIEDTLTENFDFTKWKDNIGLPALQSDFFAWYKTNNKIGWGDGSWVTGTGLNGLDLRTGKSYIYFRQNIRDKDPVTYSLPNYVVRYSYDNFNTDNFKWIRGVKDGNNNWQTADEISNITVYPGDLLLYSRKPSSTFTVAKSALITNTFSENRGSIWTNYDYIATGPKQTFLIAYPTTTYTNVSDLNSKDTYGQYPSATLTNILSVHAWKVISPNNSEVIFRNSPTLLLNATLSGLYTISVTAVSAAQSGKFGGFYYFNNIPPVTAIPFQTITDIASAFETPAPSFVLNTPIYGWDYNRSTYSKTTIFGDYGARPYWAKAYTDKSQYTDYKGVISWGNTLKLVDGYNIISQPEVSDIVLKTGSYLEYQRNANTNITWLQPLTQSATVNKNIWSTLDFNTTATSNLKDTLNNINFDLVTTPTTATSPLLLDSIIDNEPVEIYYNAFNAFTWPVTATPIITETVVISANKQQITNIKRPWANLSNRYYPNIAVLPTIQNLSSVTDFGGFFVPTNLGATQYINKDYTVSINTTSTNLTGVFENPYEYIGGRGLTKQDQNTPYEVLVENNIWLKEPIISGSLAGAIKKDIFKKYQKFIPYQTKYEFNARHRPGLSTPSSRQTPWTGKKDEQWGDLQNFPISFTGELNVNTWANSQLLKQTGLQLDNWVTDVFGNQYGLYKDIKEIKPQDRKNINGQIWVRKNSQIVEPAFTALTGVFDNYKNISLYNELTGTGIKHLDVFFDTLYIQTSGAIIFERLLYDYDTDEIYSIADEARYLSLAMPVVTNLNKELSGIFLQDSIFTAVGETWFFPERKDVIQSVCGLSSNLLFPELYRYNLNTLVIQKVFPLIQDDIITINSLSSLNLQSINTPVLTHNVLKKQFVLSLLGQNTNEQDVLVEITINDFTDLIINNITVYSSVVESQLPPSINQPLYITQDYLSSLNVQMSANNGPVTYQSLNIPDWANLTNNGLFTGTIPLTGIYYLPFVVNNNIGPTYYSLTVNAL